MFTKSKFLVLVISLSAITLVVPIVVWGLGRTPPSEARSVIVRDYLDAEQTILYIGNVDDSGAPFGVVMYDPSRLETLCHYAEASRIRGEALIASGATELYVWITFRRPLDIRAFEALVQQSGLDVRRYFIRVRGRSGDRVTISGSPDGGILIPPEHLNRAMEGIQAHENHQAELQGIFEVSGVIRAEGYRKLIQDPRVFLVDVTGSLIYRNPAFQNKTRMDWKTFTAQFQIEGGPGSPFWYMEDFGLERFTSDCGSASRTPIGGQPILGSGDLGSVALLERE